MRIQVAAELIVSDDVEEQLEQEPDQQLDQQEVESSQNEFGAIISETDSATIYDTAKEGITKPLVYKCFHKPLTPAAKERFDEVCAAAKALDHPNLTAVFEYGIASDGNAYIVSEKAEGMQLSAVLTTRGALNAVTTTAVFTQILDALDYAVSHKINVGDLAPDRIYVCGLESDAPVVKITSVGINRNAFEQDDSAKSLVQDINAAVYASPERCLGKPTDERSVVYSVGCMLYEVVFGKPAFDGTDPIKLLFDHVNVTNTTIPAVTKPGFSRFWQLVNKCMLPNPDQRFKDIATLRHHVENIEEPIKNEREASLFQQVAMRITGARTPLGGETFIVFSLLIALVCTSALIRKHVHDCERLEKRVQKLMMLGASPAPNTEEMIKSWKEIQLRGLQLAQPMNFVADCDMQIGQWEAQRNSQVESFAHYRTAANIYRRNRAYGEEVNALNAAISVYFTMYDPHSMHRDDGLIHHFDQLLPLMHRRISIARRLNDTYQIRTYTYDLAYLFAQNSHWGAAYTTMSELLRTYPEITGSTDWWMMGDACARVGDTTAAAKWYQKAYDQIKTDQWGPEYLQQLQVAIEQLELQKPPASVVRRPALISRP